MATRVRFKMWVTHFNNISEQKMVFRCFFSEVEVRFSVSAFVKCGQSWMVIPILLIWESHDRAVKLLTLV